MTINGLPLHPLVVHAAVVLVPLSAVIGIVYALKAKWRDVLRLPLALGVLAGPILWFASATGDSLKDSLQVHNPLVEEHEHWAGIFSTVGWFMSAVWILSWWALPYVNRFKSGEESPAKGAAFLATALRVLLVLLGLASLYAAYRTGDAGAKAVWQQG